MTTTALEQPRPDPIMCELFGLSASRPVAVRATPLAQFPPRGGLTADNPDGWGVAWLDADAADQIQIAKEAVAGSESARFTHLCSTLISDLVIAHVRKARFPPVNTRDNTHPFRRACCGRTWVFAHNGLVPEIVDLERLNRERICQPQGETDSEFAFCHLLSHVARHFGDADVGWLAVLAGISELIAQHGKFNFLLSDGMHLIAYGHDRLHYLETADTSTKVALVATEPLSGHGDWIPFQPGELRIYRAGDLARRIATHPPATAFEREDIRS